MVAASAALWWGAPGVESTALVLTAAFIGVIGFEMGLDFYNAMLPGLAPASHIGRLSGWSWGLGYIGGLACLILLLFFFVQLQVAPIGLDKLAAEHIRITERKASTSPRKAGPAGGSPIRLSTLSTVPSRGLRPPSREETKSRSRNAAAPRAPALTPLRAHQASIARRKRATRLPAGTAFLGSMPEKIGDAEGPATRFRYGNSVGSQSWYRVAPSGASGHPKKYLQPVPGQTDGDSCLVNAEALSPRRSVQLWRRQEHDGRRDREGRVWG